MRTKDRRVEVQISAFHKPNGRKDEPHYSARVMTGVLEPGMKLVYAHDFFVTLKAIVSRDGEVLDKAGPGTDFYAVFNGDGIVPSFVTEEDGVEDLNSTGGSSMGRPAHVNRTRPRQGTDAAKFAARVC